MACILYEGDIKKLLSFVPDGTVFKIRDGSWPKIAVMKVKGNIYKNPIDERPWRLRTVVRKIAEGKISVRDIIRAAEQNKAFPYGLPEEEKSILFYNAPFAHIGSWGGKIDEKFFAFYDDLLPEAYRCAGLNDGPVRMQGSVYKKIHNTKAQGGKRGHQVSMEELMRVRDKLKTPVAVFGSFDRNGRYAVGALTDVADRNGHLLVVFMRPDKGLGDNRLSSVYPRKNVTDFLRRIHHKGMLYYLREEMGAAEELLSEREKEDLNGLISEFRA